MGSVPVLCASCLSLEVVLTVQETAGNLKGVVVPASRMRHEGQTQTMRESREPCRILCITLSSIKCVIVDTCFGTYKIFLLPTSHLTPEKAFASVSPSPQSCLQQMRLVEPVRRTQLLGLVRSCLMHKSRDVPRHRSLRMTLPLKKKKNSRRQRSKRAEAPGWYAK